MRVLDHQHIARKAVVACQNNAVLRVQHIMCSPIPSVVISEHILEHYCCVPVSVTDAQSPKGSAALTWYDI